MTLLQDSLRNVQAPNVTLRELQQKQYQPAQIQADAPQQTNYSGQLMAIAEGSSKLADVYVTSKKDEATRTYNEAKALGEDPMKFAEAKAVEESKGLFNSAINAISEGLGFDGLRYNRAITASKLMEEQAFEIDKQLEIDMKSGRFADPSSDWKEERNKLRQTAMEEISKSVGVDAKSPYLLEGASRGNDERLMALGARQAEFEDAQLNANNKRILNADLNLLVSQGVRDPAAFNKLITDAEAAGTIRGPNDKWEFTQKILNAAVEKGDPEMLNGLLNQTIEVNGKSILLGDSLDAEIVGQLTLKTEENLIEKNEAIYAEYNEKLTQIQLLSMQGNGGAALGALQATQNWLAQYQSSDQVTSQQRQLASLKSSVKQATMRQNLAKANELDKRNDEVVRDQVAVDNMIRMEQGEPVDLYANGIKQADYDRVLQRRVESINAADLTPEQKAEAYASVVSMAPEGTNVRKAIGSTFSRGLGQADMVIARVQNGEEAGELPAALNTSINLYRANPTLAAQVMSPAEYSSLAALSEKVDTVGWTGVASVAANTKFDPATEKEFNTTVDQEGQALGLSGARLEAFRTSARLNVAGYKDNSWLFSTSKVSGGMKQTVEDFESNRTVALNDTIRVDKAALAVNSDPKTVPVVEGMLKDKLTKLEGTFDGFELFDVKTSVDGSIRIINIGTGAIAYKGSAKELYHEANAVFDENNKSRARQITEALNAETAAKEAKKQETTDIMNTRVYK